MAARRWIGIGVAAALAAGMAFRLRHAFAEPLWLDEAYSAFAADHPLAFIWGVVPRYETHPPFYYSLLRLWVLIAGDGLTALRLPGLVAGLATIAVVAAAAMQAARLLGRSAAGRRQLVAAVVALACVAEQLVQMSRQVRPYPLMILVYAGAIVLLLALRARAAAGRSIAGPRLTAYLLAVEAMLWLHNLGPLFAAALTLALAIALGGQRIGRRDRAWLAAGHAAVALAYLPALRILAGQAPTWIDATWLRLDPQGVLGHLALLFAAPGPGVVAAIGLATSAMLARGADRRVPAMLLALAITPVALSLLVSVAVAPIFITRTMTPALVPAILLYGIGATAWRGWRGWLAVAGYALLLLGWAGADLADRQAGPMQDWYALVAWLGPRLAPGDVVLAYPNEGALPLGYALRDRALHVPVLPVPAPVPAAAGPGAWYPTGSRGVVSLSRGRLRAIADAPATRAIPTIWLLRLGRRVYDPGDVALHEFARGRRTMAAFRAGDIDVRGLASGAKPLRSGR